MKKFLTPGVFTNFQTLFLDRAKYFFNKYLNERNAGLMGSLILADKSLVDSMERDRFNSLGMSHILAVSGLHIGVLALFLEFIIKNLSKNKKFTDFSLFVISSFYIMAIGFPISGLRAFLFYILYKGNTYLEEDIDTKDIFFLKSINNTFNKSHGNLFHLTFTFLWGNFWFDFCLSEPHWKSFK